MFSVIWNNPAENKQGIIRFPHAARRFEVIEAVQNAACVGLLSHLDVIDYGNYLELYGEYNSVSVVINFQYDV